jgi:predicted N-formylglutamate amidohydrolase
MMTPRTCQDSSDNVPCPKTATTYPLIGPGDPPPYSIYNDSGKAPVLLVADHASRSFPAAMQQLGLHDADLEKHIAFDIGSADVARTLADLLDAPLILSGYSRLLIDPNRQLDDPTAIPIISDGVVIPGNQSLDDAQKAERVESFFRPYHSAISERLDRFTARGISPAFISMHSFTPVYGNTERPWHIGIMWDKDGRLAEPMLAKLGQVEGINAGDNQPYSGRHPHDFTIDFHAESLGLPHVGIEVRQDLIGKTEQARQWAQVLANSLADVLADPETFRTLAHSCPPGQ